MNRPPIAPPFHTTATTTATATATSVRVLRSGLHPGAFGDTEAGRRTDRGGGGEGRRGHGRAEGGVCGERGGFGLVALEHYAAPHGNSNTRARDRRQARKSTPPVRGFSNRLRTRVASQHRGQHSPRSNSSSILAGETGSSNRFTNPSWPGKLVHKPSGLSREWRPAGALQGSVGSS